MLPLLLCNFWQSGVYGPDKPVRPVLLHVRVLMPEGPYDAEECLQFRLIRLLHIEELLHERIWSLY